MLQKVMKSSVICLLLGSVLSIIIGIVFNLNSKTMILSAASLSLVISKIYVLFILFKIGKTFDTWNDQFLGTPIGIGELYIH